MLVPEQAATDAEDPPQVGLRLVDPAQLPDRPGQAVSAGQGGRVVVPKTAARPSQAVRNIDSASSQRFARAATRPRAW